MFKRVFIPEQYASPLGLKPVDMRRLGRLVVLAGPNGAGKSRLLTAIESTNQQIRGLANWGARPTVDETVRTYLTNTLQATWRSRIGSLVEESEFDGVMRATLPPNQSIDFRPLKGWLSKLVQSARSEHREAVQVAVDEMRAQAMLGETGLAWGNTRDLVVVRNFVPRQIDLQDYRGMSQENVEASASNTASSIGVASLHAGVLSYIKRLQDQYREATHHQRMIEIADVENVRADYEGLELLISTLLGVKLGRDSALNPTLFGRRIADAGLSEGQRVLLSYAVMLHAQSRNYDQVVAMLDEPEAHLHPAATLDLVDRLLGYKGILQLWIATHSVPLIAHLHGEDPGSLWFMEDSAVAYAGSQPTAVLDSLLGGEAGRASLHGLMQLPDEIALANFATQCLLPPSVVFESPATDPQIAQIREILSDTGRPVKILDFGAGQGRVLRGLIESLGIEKLRTSINYYAFDVNPSCIEDCKKLLSEVWPGENRSFVSVDEILSSQSRFDVVLLCNALHEIPSRQWQSVMRSIQDSLTEQGHLLIVEDARLAVGEIAHPDGFHILEHDELVALFGPAAEPRIQSYDFNRDGRIQAHLVAGHILGDVSVDTILGALEILRRRALEQVRNLRASGKRTYQSGRLHAFWAQQVVNAELAQESLARR